jgi:hypothetical protein
MHSPNAEPPNPDLMRKNVEGHRFCLFQSLFSFILTPAVYARLVQATLLEFGNKPCIRELFLADSGSHFNTGTFDRQPLTA